MASDVAKQVSGDSEELEELELIIVRCPKCGGPTATGYGLMGGGLGPYTFCLEDACTWMDKQQDGEE
jgi:hypothetical protein